MFGNHAPFSYAPRGFSPEDHLQQRRGFQQDDLMGGPQQKNNMTRPNSKSIYMQRKEYSDSLNRHPDSFSVRVEHLFTCELDGQNVRTVNDCVAKLKNLDAKGRLWPQEMIMEAQGGHLLLNDIETKAELEMLPLGSIQTTDAVLDSCAYNSLLMVTVQERNKRHPQVYIFQCEETRSELIKSDLDKVIEKGGVPMEPRRDQSDIRSNLENIIGQYASGSSFRQAGPRPVHPERNQPPPDLQAMPWGNNQEPDNRHPPMGYNQQEELMHQPDFHEFQEGPGPTDTDRNTEILNHVLDDLEIFMSKLSAASNADSQQENKSKKKGVFKKKNSKKHAVSLPSFEEYFACLQKIKYGFNLLGTLDRTLTSPTAADFIHILFNSLAMILPQYPPDLPPSVLSPLLTEAALRLLAQAVDPNEDQIWRSLGDCWNIPSSRWPDGDVPPYIPEFYDGWQPPPPSPMPSLPPYQNGPMSRSNSQRFPSDRPNEQMNDSQSYSPRGMQEPMNNDPWGSTQQPPSRELPLHMRVIYDFLARNNRELSVMKGEVVEVVQKSKQWWLVRNSRGEEGNIPQNVLEPMQSDMPMSDPRDAYGPVTLDMNSTPAEVRAWLEYKGFTKLTAQSLGVLNGQLLLGMTKDEIRTVCPEEGGKVSFQLQAVKSAIALASEAPDPYYGRY